jgi:hypothetical protein
MLRQRLRTRGLGMGLLIGRLLVALVAIAGIWYGAMTILLALKVSPHAVNEISAYRTIYRQLAAIGPADITARVRIIVAIAGVLCFALFAPLAVRSLPRPYLARGEVVLPLPGQCGASTVAPRAIERAGELAAIQEPRITRAAGRYETGELHLAVSVSSCEGLLATLSAVRHRVASTLDEHELPRVPVRVTLAHFAQTNGREFQ